MVGLSPAIRRAASDRAMGVPPHPPLWGHAYCRRQCRGRRGRHMPLVRRLRMGGLLPGPCGAESRGWLLVPHYRPLRICLNLSRYRHTAALVPDPLTTRPLPRAEGASDVGAVYVHGVRIERRSPVRTRSPGVGSRSAGWLPRWLPVTGSLVVSPAPSGRVTPWSYLMWRMHER